MKIWSMSSRDNDRNIGLGVKWVEGLYSNVGAPLQPPFYPANNLKKK